MLTELSIENFAIIDALVLRFHPGFTVLTGETGAGKSIIIDALQAALGARVPPDVVRNDARFAAVEAIFDLGEYERHVLSELFSEYGVDDQDGLILRREISANGRSTSRLNGRAVPNSALAAFASNLVDIHGQSEHLSILKHERQLAILDRYGDLVPLRESVAEAVSALTRLRRELDELVSGRRDAEQRLDLLRFQVTEIEAAGLEPAEESNLMAEKNVLVNAERLIELSTRAHTALQGDGVAALDIFASAAATARELATLDPSIAPLADRLEAVNFELEDVAQEIRHYRDRMEYDPQRLDAIEERLDIISRLKRKFGATVADVTEFGAHARQQMEAVENLDDHLADLEAEGAAATEIAGAAARELRRGRLEAAGRLASAMEVALRGVGLRGTKFDVQVNRTADANGLALPGEEGRYAFSQSGIDTVCFQVSFNEGEAMRPLERVASGGETSRFMLALKSVLAEADRTPTLIFDEVDVGVGARRGMDVGERMRSLAGTHQVVSITHLPQIAALAEHHLTVAKTMRDGRTNVEVRVLEDTERVGEIAEMMSGTGSDASRRNAHELLHAANPEL